eukprot:CAMPEP_0113637688 /NCGR_PEP_ID=MMETSP0017_2-20120614/19738_1 /TAXON_ID=2856 /ORGANISM="Cylindrotheca closterium" /LENGTH=378 /DNA_ID=CAMNT_0000548749 /DNA_START=70 /DNA_END=1206 /DNA_ORIENTATION=+ /assembly_acc=CAM_ASM_000147
MKAVFLTTFCISLHVGSIESYLPQHQVVSRRNMNLKPLKSMPMPGGGGPESGGFQDMPNGPQDLPQGGPMPGAPMVPMGPGGQRSYGQSYGGNQGYDNGGGYGGGYSNGDNWYDSPHSNWNSGGNGMYNQGGGGSNWWQSGVRQSNTLQGNSRKTYSSQDPWNQRTSHVYLQSERPNAPLDAKIDYLHGPGNVARQMKVWSMDGYQRPVRANFANPSGGASRGNYGTMDVRNTGPMEFPISAGVSQSPQTMGYGGRGLMQGPEQQMMAPGGMSGPMRMGGMAGMKQMQTVQGESLKTFSFDPNVNFVQIDLETDGMPCYADIEVSQGPGEARQTMQVYSDDGTPWEGVVELPGYGSTITIKNVGPMAYPIKASCEPIG